MKYYFAWAKEGTLFSPETHLREDEKIFSLHIFEAEGTVPHARILLENPNKKKIVQEENEDNREGVNEERSYCFISVKDTQGSVKLLFQGRLINFPSCLEGELVTLDFVALSKKGEENYQKIFQDLKASKNWEDLFLPLSGRDTPSLEDLLSSQHQLIHWDRSTHNVSLSNIVQGKTVCHLDGKYYRDSLKTKVTKSPLEAIEIHLHAKWVQRFQGATTLDSFLQKDLPEGVIATYSGKDLEKKWWRADQRFNQSGYSILSSSLEAIESLEKTDSFWISPQDPLLKKSHSPSLLQKQDPKKIRFKQKSYRPHLKIGWRYVQPRHEEAIALLKNSFQPLSYKPSQRKVIHLTLKDLTAQDQLSHWGKDLYYKRHERLTYKGTIYQAQRSHRSSQCFDDDLLNWKALGDIKTYPLQEHRGTFFKTDRGRQTIEHALNMAQAYLCASSRCIEISFICPLEQALTWTCDHSLSLKDSRFPGGKAMGKIRKITFEVIGKTGRMRAYITLACCIGSGIDQVLGVNNRGENYAANGVLEDDTPLQSYKKTITGLSYHYNLDPHSTERGILYPMLLGASDLLRDMIISNDCKQQKEALLDKQYPHSHNLSHSLKGHATQVKLRLEDLRGTQVEKSIIPIKVAGPWSAPQHINLGG